MSRSVFLNIADVELVPIVVGFHKQARRAGCDRRIKVVGKAYTPHDLATLRSRSSRTGKLTRQIIDEVADR